MLYSILKPLLFSLPPEKAHNLTLELASLSPILGKLSGTALDPRLGVKVGQNKWSFPIGLAAGLDKNAEALDFFSHQGFGALECGTITLLPQDGNPLPRMFRYPEEESLRNAMGFPNQGLLKILYRVKNYDNSLPLGANIGKNKDSSPEESIEELCVLFDTLQSEVDYFVINVSSPNTPGLRAMQERTYLSELFQLLNRSRTKDLYLKIAPDLEESKIIELSELAAEYKLTGIIATNTTMMPERGVGGVSGVLLREKARLVRDTILKEELPLELIGVGGITEVDDLFEFWARGGKVAQVYTAYVYQGPALLKKMKREILNFLNVTNLPHLESFFNLPLLERQKRLKEYRARK